METDPSAVWDFAREVVGAARPDRGHTLATVTRIDADGTTWVTTGDGGEAPAASAAAGVSVGDTVMLEWDGAAMGIRGNVSNPSPAGSVVRRAVARAQGVADAAQRVADAVNQHFFADTSGIHVTEATQEEWDASHAGANVLINSVGQLFRDGLNNLLTLTTENGARALTVWDGLGNAASNVRAIIGETITLGGTSESHVVVSQDAITMLDAKGNVFMDVRDNGLYQTRTYTLTASGLHGTVFPDPQPMLIKDSETDVTITVDGVPYEYGVDVTFDKHSAGDVVTLYDVWFRDTVPAAGSTIVVTFRTESDKTYTLGKRTDGTTEGPYSVVEGYNNEASGYMSHAEGGGCSSTNSYAHSEGSGCMASHLYAHAEGFNTTASERAAHSEGWGTIASGAQSHAQNRGTIAASEAQTAMGRYNANDPAHALEIGNGTSDSARSNALTVDWYGNAEFAGKLMAAYAEDTCTIESGATEYNLNACWSNGACCTITLSVNLTSALANGGTVRIATAPSGYVPPYSVIGSCYVTGATAQVMAIIGTGGGITLNNRSGSSISTSANVYVSFTFVPA